MTRNIFWFRQDLRLNDNPGLRAAASSGELMAIYILDETAAQPDSETLGGAARWWLHESLEQLNASLDGKLHVYRGDAYDIILKLVRAHAIDGVYWNRCYEPRRIKTDTKIKTALKKQGLLAQSHQASLLFEPWDVLKADGTPYKVFTAFYERGCLRRPEPRLPVAKPAKIKLYRDAKHKTVIRDLELVPTHLDWPLNLKKHWGEVSEKAALKRLKDFVKNDLNHYSKQRDIPAAQGSSSLSPYLQFGQLSPHQVWHLVQMAGVSGQANEDEVSAFSRQLGWREFSHSLLYYFPDLPYQNMRKKFDAFAWHQKAANLKAWQRGLTGYPMVDAGMRELWQTGYMHNRVRMIVGSFLVKNLLIHWHRGEEWFWDCLVDASLANNSASWQWVAGSGVDAAPYFRIFNPVTQGERFDPHGEYVKAFVPELRHLPVKYLFKPWAAPAEVLARASVVLGKTYPKPIVDLASSRVRALEAYAQL